MFISANTIKQGSQLEYDLCIVGAGAVGLTLGLALKDRPWRICILESGDLNLDKQLQELNDIETAGLPVSDEIRARVFGGSTVLWAGRWKPHDEIDFKKRDWVPNSGWPISYGDLKPYYQSAARLLTAPDLDGFQMEQVLSIISPQDRRVFKDDDVQTTVFRWLRQQDWNWGKKFREEFKNSKIDVYLNANVVNLNSDQSGKKLLAVNVKTLKKNVFSVRAKNFVLAAGGLENARLLLMSTAKEHPRGIGNNHDQVGRYYMDHPKGVVGVVKPFDRKLFLPLYWGTGKDAGFTRAGLALTEAAQSHHRVLNSYVLLEPVFPWSYNPGLSAAIALAQKIKNRKIPSDIIVQYIREIFKNQKIVGRWLSAKVIEKIFKRQARVEKINLWNFMEQVPDPKNRVVLSSEKDALGSPKIRLNWRIGQLDRQTMVVMHQVLKGFLERQKIGILESPLLQENLEEWPISNDASHHMGTTRMGTDPKTSVIDPDCRVHGMDNLFIAGNSVIPASGYANPTFTICALAVRLAVHLEQKYGK